MPRVFSRISASLDIGSLLSKRRFVVLKHFDPKSYCTVAIQRAIAVAGLNPAKTSTVGITASLDHFICITVGVTPIPGIAAHAVVSPCSGGKFRHGNRAPFAESTFVVGKLGGNVPGCSSKNSLRLGQGCCARPLG